MTADTVVHLRSRSVSVVLDLRDARPPSIAYWGADLGPLGEPELADLVRGAERFVTENAPDRPTRLAVLPEQSEAWLGRPGITGSRDGRDWSPLFTMGTAQVTPRSVTVDGRDTEAGLSVRLEFELSEAGLLRVRATLGNTADGIFRLDDLHLALPIPARAREVLDLAGRWGKERTPQRAPLHVGAWVREDRRGRTGPDAPLVLNVGVPGFGFAAGEVWGVHVGWSGNQRHLAERVSTGDQVIGGGELLLPDEVRLGPGETYTSPWVYGAYGDGLDAQAALFHEHLRSRPSHPTRDRPITLNVWEAVYFDHDAAALTELAEVAASLGIERFVLDDGWFRGRRHDRAGLGDWFVDEAVWPEGLQPLADRVRALGMEFGLWFEPEMVNLDSDLAREHPDWVMQTGGRLPVPARNQHVLDLGRPEAFASVLERMTAILTEVDIAYIKWDQNRDLVDAGSAPGGQAGVHRQTAAVYRLMDELANRFPGLEIESCSSGGSRVDLGVLERTQRVWASDCSDPLERQQINRWTAQLVPLERLGAHIASGRSHTTGRSHELSFRATTALFGHLGVEWDLRQASPAELDELREWFALYRSTRALLHTGRLIREDMVDDALQITGVVAADGSSALYALAFLGRSDVARIGRFTLRGLDPERRYRVRPLRIGEPAGGRTVPAWFGDEDDVDGPLAGWTGVVASGRSLLHAGLQTPSSHPERAWMVEVTAVGDDDLAR
ncbi:alpha-galactosidase [Plantibacter sp. ME-Dv--P-122b]|uniref:alpha-galactosidase n=1 Tax=Plantibacter sp. ME-Dv--P-122b TaxID=3040300 RepID=UPI002550778F|nr:alpha-galactosidase [Plantibacter sp. ME-Dv--P-122b]